MPLMADRNRIPDHFGSKGGAPTVKFIETLEAPRRSIRVGLVNNMPDSALKDTESQFFRLLASAAGNLPVHVSLYSLPEIPRDESGKKHIASFYRGIDELRESGVDAVIVTGTEPRHPDLRQERYWMSLASLFEWAETNTKSAVLSCLAAHASVLHADGIERHPLGTKRCGVFIQSVVRPHALTEGVCGPIGLPHSRWNEVREDELVAAGYTILTKSAEAGVDLFAKKKRRSLFAYFQGHPEYGPRTLLKEYRRDVGRFLRKESEDYPSMPGGYFDSDATKLAADFETRARLERDAGLLSQFPSEELAHGLKHQWRPAALQIYGNWLRYIAARKIEAPRLAAAAGSVYRNRSF
jgi:homoserine O-succinyltransferase